MDDKKKKKQNESGDLGGESTQEEQDVNDTDDKGSIVTSGSYGDENAD